MTFTTIFLTPFFAAGSIGTAAGAAIIATVLRKTARGLPRILVIVFATVLAFIAAVTLTALLFVDTETALFEQHLAWLLGQTPENLIFLAIGFLVAWLVSRNGSFSSGSDSAPNIFE